jgi:glycosyltransferase involved in cell wall biosynthesis
MKIGVVCDVFGNLNRGGAEVQLDNTLKFLNRIDGISAEIIDYSTKELEQYDIVHFFKSIYYFVDLAKVLIDKKIPYVVSSIFFPEGSIRKALYMFKLPILLPGRMKDALAVRKVLHLWENAAYVFPNTDDEAAFISKLCPKTAIEIIPNGLNFEEMQEVGSDLFLNTFPFLKGQKFVLNIARIDKRKNQKNLVKACMKLQVPIVNIGYISDIRYYKEIQDLKYDKFFHINPIYDRRDLLFSAYSASTVFCLPSTMETPGIAAMEAMYYNKPIVITKFGGTKFYFKNNAYYVDWRNVDEIAQGIQYCYDKPTPFSRSLIEEYSWDKIANLYVSFYKKILNQI